MSAQLLLVDDEPDAHDLFCQNFRREIRKGSLDVEFAQSGNEALSLLNRQGTTKTHLVLSDINMPGMTGIELLEKIRAQWPEIPVLMISAYADRSTEKLVSEKGAI